MQFTGDACPPIERFVALCGPVVPGRARAAPAPDKGPRANFSWSRIFGKNGVSGPLEWGMSERFRVNKGGWPSPQVSWAPGRGEGALQCDQRECAGLNRWVPCGD